MLTYLALGPLPGASVDSSTVYLMGTDPRSGGGSAGSGIGLTKTPDGLSGLSLPRQYVGSAVGRNGSLVKTRLWDGRKLSIEGEVFGTDYTDLHSKMDPILAMMGRTVGAQYAQAGWPIAGKSADVPIYLQWQRQGGGPHLSQEVYLAADVMATENMISSLAAYRADFVSPERHALRRTDASAGYTAPASSAISIPATVTTASGSIAIGGTAPARVSLQLVIPSGTGTTPAFSVTFTNASYPTYSVAFYPLAYTPTTNYGTYLFSLAERTGTRVSGAATYPAFPLQLVKGAPPSGFGPFFDLPAGVTWTVTVSTTTAGTAGSTVRVLATEAYV